MYRYCDIRWMNTLASIASRIEYTPREWVIEMIDDRLKEVYCYV